eukprot:SAG31_NODE_7986_length_1546_cov_207.155494_2_plen_171_part_00
MLLAAGVSTRKCGSLLSSILAGLGKRLSKVPSPTFVQSIAVSELRSLGQGQACDDLRQQQRSSSTAMMDEAAKGRHPRLAVSVCVNEDGKVGGCVKKLNLDTVDLKGRTADHVQESFNYTLDNVAAAGNAISRELIDVALAHKALRPRKDEVRHTLARAALSALSKWCDL